MGLFENWKKDRDKRRQLRREAKENAETEYWRVFREQAKAEATKKAREQARQDAKPRDMTTILKGIKQWLNEREINPEWERKMGFKNERKGKEKRGKR